jgi:adenosylmethionine-8-amino-7-oxononanoate aminotransferase
MRIIGCDLHARQQTLAMLDTTTGEVVNATLKHEGSIVREFQACVVCSPKLRCDHKCSTMICALVTLTVTTTLLPHLQTELPLVAGRCFRQTF